MPRQRASAKFAESADQMQNLVYEQADSLEPVNELEAPTHEVLVAARNRVEAAGVNGDPHVSVER